MGNERIIGTKDNKYAALFRTVPTIRSKNAIKDERENELKLKEALVY
jgi:hypothetical protein